MAFKCLPYTYTFCRCTRKLKAVSIFIAIYSVIRALPIIYFLNNPCCPDDGYRKSGLGLVEHILGVILLLLGLTFSLISLLLIFDIYCRKCGITELYIIGVVFVVPVSISYWTVHMVLYQTQLEKTCKKRHAEMIIAFLCLIALIDGVLLCYFALIVNSQDQFRLHGLEYHF